MVSVRKSWEAARTFTTRSAPTLSGSSTSSVMGSGDVASTSSAWRAVVLAMPSATLSVTAGATDARQAARTSLGERPAWSRNAATAAAHSSGVRSGWVVSRQCASSPWARNSPSVISVFPMSRVSSIVSRQRSAISRQP